MAYSQGKIMDLYSLKEYGLSPNNILDIGAHKGQFYKWAKEIWPDSSITMIEANTCHENDLRQLVSQSTNDRFILATLGDSKRVVTFYTRTDKPGTEGASYYKELNYWDIPNLVMQIPCELQVLDEMFDYETYELIKIDTQGSELDIMAGGLNLCKRAKFIILEISVIPYNEGAPTADEYYDFMKSLNFIEYACVGEHISNGQVIQRDIAFINQELK